MRIGIDSRPYARARRLQRERERTEWAKVIGDIAADHQTALRACPVRADATASDWTVGG